MLLSFEHSVLANSYSCACALPSLNTGLTTLFGMGRGMTPVLNHQNRMFNDILYVRIQINLLHHTNFYKKLAKILIFIILQSVVITLYL